MTQKKSSTKPAISPMMQQYQEIKQKHQKSILFFRLGDFYEMFGEDAKIASKILQITLTSRDKKKENAMPLCGIPYHAAGTYIARLIKAGYSVAICEQVEDPKNAKGIVKREVIRVITPGTVIDSNVLMGKENNFLGAIVVDDGIGLAFVDISTGEFWVTEYLGSDWPGKLETELFRKSPKEIVIPPGETEKNLCHSLKAKFPMLNIESVKKELYQKNAAKKFLQTHFKAYSLSSLGCESNELAILAAYAALLYLQETQKCELKHLSRLRFYSLDDYMIIDATTQQHLELVSSWPGIKRSGSLLQVLDKTETPMGGRMLKHWLLHPLLNIEDINQRLDAVEYFVKKQNSRKQLIELLKKIYDLERICGKIALYSASPQDLVSLKNSLEKLPQLKVLFKKGLPSLLSSLIDSFDQLQDIYQWIDECIVDVPPPPSAQEAGIIKTGFSPELDELRQIAFDGKTWIAQLENKERQKTGISSLKIKYNKVFGFFLEVTRPNLPSVPASYIRKQTIANGERFITAELKEYETKVLTAQEKIQHLEKCILRELLQRICVQISRLQETSHRLATLDVLCALAEIASLNRYEKPMINDGDRIHIKEGRHPVVEQLAENERFVPNDTLLDCVKNQLLIITGPNMAGKSTFIRQTALITLMAQIGSFIPADEAVIGVVDRIFTRVGASDNLIQGQSTFMVEMSETAKILNNATNRSLIILDEIGRGTSTYDGMSIAWAVAEYLHGQEIGAKTLFATHYHELTSLADSLEKAQNYNVLVKEFNDEIIFLRRIIAGSADRSYGIQVARLAGVPSQVIHRSKEILESLEKKDRSLHLEKKKCRPRQLPLIISPEEYIITELKERNFAKLSPKEALKIIKKWQKIAQE